MSGSRLRLGLQVGALALPLLLSGCSGTPFGESLSRSFSPAGAGTPPPPAADPPAPLSGSGRVPARAPLTTARPPEPAPPTPPTRSGQPSGAPASPGAANSSAAPPGAPSRPASRPSAPAPGNPVPYRVTLRLPAADPAAPAEVVTQALRAAGVPFEVETIERLPRNGPTAPSSTAAPLPPAPPPAARPAPAPR